MDHTWAAEQLKDFRNILDDYIYMTFYHLSQDELDPGDAERYEMLIEKHGSASAMGELLISRNPIMRQLMNAAQPELGSYPEPPEDGWSYNDSYWQNLVLPRVLRAAGIHEFGEEASRRMQPESPDLVADQFHPWVWAAASPLWYAGSRQEAVHAAARSVNARMQQKRGHHDKSDASLCREFFSLDKPTPGRPRLRFDGYTRTDLTWRSRQQGAMEFGAGCFEAIRNPAAHEHGLVLSEQVALEQLAAFSLLARWIDECIVETASSE
jgi:Protein of unknown function (Hypoth_ymh)